MRHHGFRRRPSTTTHPATGSGYRPVLRGPVRPRSGGFDDALADLEDRDEYDKATEFIVYRGAPGCGKTSLVKHLRHQRGDGALFVDIDLEHLASADTLIGRVLEQASEAGSLGSRIGGKVVEALGSRLRMRDVAKDASDFVATRVAKGTRGCAPFGRGARNRPFRTVGFAETPHDRIGCSVRVRDDRTRPHDP